MSDKLINSLMNIPEFADGEMPDSLKLNAAFTTISNALQRLEKYFNDVTNTSTDNEALSDQPLGNIAFGRIIGPIGNIQPPAVVDEDFAFECTLETGFNEWVLPMWPTDSVGSVVLSVVSSTDAMDADGNLIFQNQVNSTAKLEAIGDWKYDLDRNAILSYSILDSGNATAQCTSHVGAEAGNGLGNYWYLGNAGLNVMPSFNITPATSITVATSTSTSYDYIVTLHPEDYVQYSPIATTSNTRYNKAAMEIAGSYEEERYGVNPIPTVTTKVPQKLPYYLNSLSPGDEIPSPYLSIYKEGSPGSVVTSGNYYYRDQTSFFFKGATLDTSGTHRVLTPGGQNISSLLEGLIFSMQHHDHAGPNAIFHQDIAGAGYKPIASLPAALTDTKYGWHRPMTPAGNSIHPQYYNRFGYDEGQDNQNLNNVLLGHIPLGMQVSNIREAGTSDIWNNSGKTWGVNYGGRALTYVDEYSSKQFLVTELNAVRGNMVVSGTTNDSIYPGGGPVTGESLGSTNTAYYDDNNVQAQFNLIGDNLNLSVTGGPGAFYQHDIVGSNITSSNIGSELILAKIYGTDLVSNVSTSKNVKVNFAGETATANIQQCTNFDVNLLFTNKRATFQNISNASARIVLQNSGTDPGGTDQFSSARIPAFGIYDRATYIIQEADVRPVTRAITPARVQVLYQDSTAFGDDGTLYAPVSEHVQYLSYYGDTSFVHATGNNRSLGMYFDLWSDCIMSEININLSYEDVTLTLFHVGSDATLTIATSTSYTGGTFASTSLINWNLGTAFKTLGARFTNASGSALDYALYIRNDAASTNGVILSGGSYTYQLGRL